MQPLQMLVRLVWMLSGSACALYAAPQQFVVPGFMVVFFVVIAGTMAYWFLGRILIPGESPPRSWISAITMLASVCILAAMASYVFQDDWTTHSGATLTALLGLATVPIGHLFVKFLSKMWDIEAKYTY